MNRCAAAILCVLTICGGAKAALAAQGCELKRVAELHADVSGGALLIPIQIDGHDAQVMMDTGSPVNLISPRLAAQLNLTKSRIESGAVIDGSGKPMQHLVTVHKLSLGGMVAEDVPFVLLGESGQVGPGLDGVFGANFIEAYDVELDLAHGKVNFYLPNTCPAPPVYWTQDYAEIPIRIDASMHPVLQVKLDGKPLTVMLDTGASISTVSQQTARRTFDVDPEARGATPDGQVSTGSGATLPFFRHVFSTLEIGDAAFRNPELLIVPQRVNHFIEDKRYTDFTAAGENMATQVTVGLRQLTKLRAYLAFRSDKLYLSAANAQ